LGISGVSKDSGIAEGCEASWGSMGALAPLVNMMLSGDQQRAVAAMVEQIGTLWKKHVAYEHQKGAEHGSTFNSWGRFQRDASAVLAANDLPIRFKSPVDSCQRFIDQFQKLPLAFMPEVVYVSTEGLMGAKPTGRPSTVVAACACCGGAANPTKSKEFTTLGTITTQTGDDVLVANPLCTHGRTVFMLCFTSVLVPQWFDLKMRLCLDTNHPCALDLTDPANRSAYDALVDDAVRSVSPDLVNILLVDRALVQRLGGLAPS